MPLFGRKKTEDPAPLDRTREPLPPTHTTTPVGDVTVTDVQARPLEPVTQTPVTQTPVTPAADGRVPETAAERDHRA